MGRGRIGGTSAGRCEAPGERGRRSATAAVALGLGCCLAAPALALDPPSVVVVSTPAELQEKFCAADATKEHVFVLPAAMFVDSEEMICPAGPYKLYRILEHNDPDDFEYYLDPPFGTTGRLGCDGKGGKTMTWVAVNCRPE